MNRQRLDSVVVLEFGLTSENPNVARRRGNSSEQKIIEEIVLGGIGTRSIAALNVSFIIRPSDRVLSSKGL